MHYGYHKYNYLKGKTDMENRSEIILYQTTDGATKIDVRLEDETVWLNQNQLETLFQTDRTSIVKHIKKYIRIR